MKQKITETITLPEGVSCEYAKGTIKCSKGSVELSRQIKIPEVSIKTENGSIALICEKGNKTHKKRITSALAHVRNMLLGLDNKFVYELEAVNVHFPMTLKLEGSKIIINNFLGEKTPRHSKVLPNVSVEIKGKQIIISSHDIESAGQTAANLEKATKVRGRDRRIYQDGIFITKKPERVI